MKTLALSRLTLAALAVGIFIHVVPARAGDDSGGEVAGGPMPSYDLFHPVPSDKLRDFNPDRPGAFTGPFTVDPGHFQWEMDAANYTYDRHNPEHAPVDVDEWNVAPFDLRVGLTSHTEIDFLYGSYVNLRVRDHEARGSSVQSGVGDLTLLFKYAICGDDGGTFAFGILPYLKIPTNITFLSYTFLAKKLTLYLEFYSRVNAGSDSEVVGTIDTAFIYTFSKNAEVDFGCNYGVTRAAADYHPFAGFTVRY